MKVTTEYTGLTMAGLEAPKGWRIAERRADGMLWQRLIGEKITVIESIAIELDGKRWLHVSVAKPNKKTPSYDDVQLLRKLFIGEEMESYMIFPPKQRYVNINPVLHLFACLDQPNGVLPQFEGMINGKNSI